MTRRDPEIKSLITGEYAWAVLHAAAPRLADDGWAVALLADGFNWRPDAARAKQYLADAGLHVQAIISVPGALRPASEVEASLVAFSRTPANDVFVGRLTPDMDSAQLLDNMIARRDGAQRELGRLLAHDEYRTWASYESRELLREAIGEAPFPTVHLEDVAELATVDTGRIDVNTFSVPPNAVYIPEVGLGKPLLAPNLDDGKGRRYTEARLDPERADARFIATWLDSPLGRLARGAVGAGSTRTHTSARASGALTILLPDVATQRAAVETDRHLTEISLRVEELRNRVWVAPQNAPDISAEVSGVRTGASFEDWINSLPFPLASIAYRYMADPSPYTQVERLLHFFEATAQFAVTILLSAVAKDSTFFDRAKERLATADPQGRGPLERSTFGTWTHLGQTLAKLVRTERGAKEATVDVRLLFPSNDTALLDALIAKDTWKVIDAARVIRNSQAHGGVRSHEELAASLAQLLSLLVDLRSALGHAFAHVDLVRPGPSLFENETFRHEAAERLTGPVDVFFKRPLESAMPLEGARLYLVPRSQYVTNALKLLPLFKLSTPVETQENVVYFFSGRRADGRFDFVSYHFQSVPRNVMDDAELSSLIAALTPASPA